MIWVRLKKLDWMKFFKIDNENASKSSSIESNAMIQMFESRKKKFLVTTRMNGRQMIQKLIIQKRSSAH